MKTLFIPAKSKFTIDKSKILKESRNLPKNIIIAYSIQYKNQAQEIKQLLEKIHRINKFTQILGCTKLNLHKDTKAVLLISDGKFHAISMAHETKLPIYIIDNNKINEISKKDIESFEKRQKATYLNFLNSDKVGILISTKPGQENLKKAMNLKRKLNARNSKNFCATKSKSCRGKDFVGNKKSYLFIANNINTAEFENFGIDSWVNTSCPRLDMNDNRVININRLNLID